MVELEEGQHLVEVSVAIREDGGGRKQSIDNSNMVGYKKSLQRENTVDHTAAAGKITASKV